MKKASKAIRPVFYVIEILWALLFIIFIVKAQYYRAAGCILWGSVFAYLYLIQPFSKYHQQPFAAPDGKVTRKHDVIIAIVCLVLILACILPMGLAPAYNGEFPQHRNQYEILAHSLKEGHVWLDLPVDPKLLEINPYEPAERVAAEVDYYSDHAFYNGKYYMYFGVVPAILLFLPYLLITGQDLTTYHATQFFAAFAILGIFLLFRKLAKKFFPSMSFLLFLSLTTAFAWICTYFSVGTPALYCTATTSAACFSIWSIYFFTSGVFLTEAKERWKRVLFASLGSLFGAAAFGCRPSGALGAFLLVIPFFFEYLRTELQANKSEKSYVLKLIGRICVIGLPYVIIGLLLMYYNYVRFGTPTEFGQSYQLTVCDQSKYGSFFEEFSTVRTVNGILYNFIGFTPIIGEFPFVYYNSTFVNFPILLMIFGAFTDKGRAFAKQTKMRPFTTFLFLAPLVTTVMQIAWAPGNGSAERYRMDIYYLVTLLAFIVIGSLMKNLPEQKQGFYGFLLCLLCLQVMFFSTLYLLFPDDYNYTHWFPEKLPLLRQVFMFK